jgi:hypothetical protein
LLANGMIRIVSAGFMVDGALDAVAQTAMRNSLAADEAADGAKTPQAVASASPDSSTR